MGHSLFLLRLGAIHGSGLTMKVRMAVIASVRLGPNVGQVAPSALRLDIEVR